MKRSSIISFALVLAMAVVLFPVMQGCKSSKETAKPSGETLIEQYCAGPEYFTDNETFRASSVGESMDQATSKKKALSNAKAELAGYIQTILKATLDNYVVSRELNNVEEVEEKYEGLSREVINQTLSGIRTICEKVTKTENGNYKTYMAIELAGDQIMEVMNQRMSKDDKLKIDYDYEKFKETFNEEMEKLEKQRGN